MTHDRQAQAQSAVQAPAGTVSLAKTIKHIGKEARIYANARIDHFQLHTKVERFQPHLYASAFRSELYRVGEQVPDYLLEAVGIAWNRSCFLKKSLKSDLLGFGGQLHSLQSCFNERTKLDRLNI